LYHNRLCDFDEVFHVKRDLWSPCLLAGLLGLAACESPSDTIFDRPAFSPIEEQAGLFRVTSGSGPDVARGFLPDGRLLFRAYDIPPFGRDWVLLSVPLTGGQVREEAGVYRPALLDEMGQLTVDGSTRALVLWKSPVPGIHGCPDSSLTSAGSPGPAPRTPTPVGFTIYALPPTDGTPVAAIPSRFVSTNMVNGIGTLRQRVRVNPALRDVDRTGSNAFGPVLLPGTGDVIYSDGEQLWRAPLADSTVTPVLAGVGAYPALSPDGRTLAYARPTGLDSVVRTFSIPLGLAFCVEEHVEVSAARWEIFLQDLETGTETFLTEGLDPAFDPLAGRLAVRGDALSWVDLTSGTLTPIPGTLGGYGPIPSPDGTLLVFSRLNDPTNSDVYFVRITR
jgi:Tol biopolymer transport system component